MVRAPCTLEARSSFSQEPVPVVALLLMMVALTLARVAPRTVSAVERDHICSTLRRLILLRRRYAAEVDASTRQVDHRCSGFGVAAHPVLAVEKVIDHAGHILKQVLERLPRIVIVALPVH